MKVDKFYYPVDFVVLDTEPVAEGIHQVLIILGRPFLATSNAIINCRNGVMQLSFGNMTLEINIFHLSNKHKSVEDEEQNSAEVCLSGTSVGKHSAQARIQLQHTSLQAWRSFSSWIPHKPLGYTHGSGSYRNLGTTPIFDGIFVLHNIKF